MSSDAEWFAARSQLRFLLHSQPTWSITDLAQALGRSVSWVKKWKKRIRAAPEDERVLLSRSRARHHPPPSLDQAVIDRILDIRDHPPQHLHRTPGPKAILYYLQRDPLLKEQRLRLPRSTRTIWQLLTAHGRIAPRTQRSHTPTERPEPLSSWQLDFKDVSSVPGNPDGKRQHVVEVLDIVDVGSSFLVAAHVREDFTAATALQALIATFGEWGLPSQITLDRDPRFVGSAQGADFPSALVRLLYCLGLHVTICPPRRPDKNAFVERYHRTFEYECLRIVLPSDLVSAQEATSAFRRHYNYERPNQAITCSNRPPCQAIAQLPPRPALPAQIDPDRWVEVLNGTRFVRKVRTNGSVSVDGGSYYIDQAWEGKYVTLRVEGASRSFVVEHREQALKQVPIKGLVGERLALSTYLELIVREAQTHNIAGGALGQQLRLALEYG